MVAVCKVVPDDIKKEIDARSDKDEIIAKLNANIKKLVMANNILRRSKEIHVQFVQKDALNGEDTATDAYSGIKFDLVTTKIYRDTIYVHDTIKIRRHWLTGRETRIN